MDNIEIFNMTISDLNLIKDNTLSDFDDFWNINILESELNNPNSKYIFAKHNNKIVGIAGIWESVDDIHITNIIVHKSFRKKGIGSLLLSNLIQMSMIENISSITLEVNYKNTEAIKLYEKYYFKKVGIRKKYYNNTDDAIIMTLYLNKMEVNK